jgi:MFS family permease
VALGPYREVLRAPHAPRLAGSALLGRLPGGMSTLSIILIVRDSTGSFGIAGAVAGCHGVGSAFGQPLQGRLIDRFGQPRVLLPAAALFAVSYCAVALASGVALLLALGAVSGLAFPALAAALRALWPALLRRDATRPNPSLEADPQGRGAAHELQTAYSLDAAVQELMLIGGPLLVAALVALDSDAALVGVAAALSLTGTVAFATAAASRQWRGADEPRHWAGPLRARGIRTLVLVAFLGSGPFGWLQISVTSFAEDHGEPAAAGVLFALWSGGSLLAGLLYGAHAWRGSPRRRYLMLTALLVAASAVPMLAGSLPGMAAALTLAGCAFSPWLATSYLLVDPLAPPGTVTEAFAWLVTGSNAGAAAGAAMAGPVIQTHGTDAALAAAPATALLALAALLLARHTLRPSVAAATDTRR